MSGTLYIDTVATVGIYCALNTMIMIWYTVKIIRLRRTHKISIGDGGHPLLARTMRGHANIAENSPAFMLMLTLTALMGSPFYILHGFGLTFTISRLIHAYYFLQEDAPIWQRVLGFGLSLTTLSILAISLLIQGLILAIWPWM